MLRVGARAWEDLEEDPPPESPEAAAEKHGIVRRFYDEFSAAARIDGGRRIDAVDDPKIFRIRSGDWRAAVRYSPEDGTVWLCRALCLADFNDEQHAYLEFDRLFDTGSMLPGEKERKRARGDHFLVGAVLALSQARVNADNDPGVWRAAACARLDGTEHRIGQIYAERERDELGDYVRRFVLLVAAPPPDVALRDDRREFVLAFIFTSDDPVTQAYNGLPPGTNRQADEPPYVQETIEPHDEAEVNDRL